MDELFGTYRLRRPPTNTAVAHTAKHRLDQDDQHLREPQWRTPTSKKTIVSLASKRAWDREGPVGTSRTTLLIDREEHRLPLARMPAGNCGASPYLTLVCLHCRVTALR
jgi:hypothetical protein